MIFYDLADQLTTKKKRKTKDAIAPYRASVFPFQQKKMLATFPAVEKSLGKTSLD